LQKLFGRNDNKNALREAQSAIAKAINQLDKQESKEPTAKLQTHLNEKSNRIKELEKTLERKSEDLEIALEKAKALELELNKAKTIVVTETVPVAADNRELQELSDKYTNLNRQNEELRAKFSASQQELGEAWDLTLEFSKRLKKLKAEILAS